MRLGSAAWERTAEVRAAADGWRRAGAIDRATHEAVRTAYPDPCVTPSAVWRLLTAAMVTAVVLCTLGAVWVATKPDTVGLSLLLAGFAGAGLVATEGLEASPRLARRGAAGATSFWGGVFLLVGLGVFLQDLPRVQSEHAINAVLVAGVLVWAAGCWRWGNPLFAALSAVSLFLFLARVPLGRPLWVLAGAALAGLAARRTDHAAWAPSHRRAAMVLLVMGVAAPYVALNVYSVEVQWIEGFRQFVPGPIAWPPALFVLSTIATAVLPLAILGGAWRSRRTLLLDTGIVLLAASLVTARHYVHLAPLWVVLTASGAMLIALALAVERALRGSPGGERAGFTADALFSDERRQQMLLTVPVVAALTPAASPAVAEEPGFTGGGGRFGGGGASDRF